MRLGMGTIVQATCSCGYCSEDLFIGHARLVARWNAGERDMAADVRDALVAGPLLEFDEPVAIRLSAGG
jgi:hypothetical protein